MTTDLYTFFIGIVVSLAGSLPLGNLNINAMYVAGQGKVRSAFWFASGVVLAEMCCLLLVLFATALLLKNAFLFPYLQVAGIITILLLAWGSFTSVYRSAVNPVMRGGFWRGLGMSLVNPLQIPFWLGWSAWLMSQELLAAQWKQHIAFCIGAGMGTFLALGGFILLGKALSARMQLYHGRVNMFMGIVFLITALIQIYHTIHKFVR